MTAERLGDVVEPVKVKINRTTLIFRMPSPEAPGRYRLTVTLHDEDGVAFDAATQALLPTLIVRVTGEVDAQIVAPARAEIVAGAPSNLELWVANLGKAAWGHGAVEGPREPRASTGPGDQRHGQRPMARDRHRRQGDRRRPRRPASSRASCRPACSRARSSTRRCTSSLPPSPGSTCSCSTSSRPDHGSIVATGLEPTIIRVTVAAPKAAE